MTSTPKITLKSWALLALLSLIWGGSFFFVGLAVKELPAILIVFARLAIAASALLPIHFILQGALPKDLKTWGVCAGMGFLNNTLPFTAISWGQHHMDSGLAAIINATSPMFAAGFMVLFGMEVLGARKAFALALGLIGVIILKGGNFQDFGPQTWGIMAVAFASACYGLSTVWSKKYLIGISPLTTATCQLVSSSLTMALVAFTFSTPASYANVSISVWAALIALGVVSTSIAYLIFFRLVNTAGPSFTVLVTMIIPLSAVLLGYLFLGERLTMFEGIGASIIILALIIIDGRALKIFSRR